MQHDYQSTIQNMDGVLDIHKRILRTPMLGDCAWPRSNTAA